MCGIVREYTPYDCMWPVRDEDHIPETGEVFYSQVTSDEKIHMIKREFRKDDAGHIYSEYKVRMPGSSEVKIFSDYGLSREQWKKQIPAMLKEAGLENGQKTAVVQSEERFKKYQEYGEKQYQFSTFLKHLSSEALVLTYAGIHGVTRDVEKKFNQILSIRKRIAATKRIDIYEVTPEMVHELKPDYSVRDIKAVFDYLDGRISVEKMLEEDGMEGEAFEDPNGEAPDLKNDIMDINVQKLFDLFLDRMSDLEKFFALIEIGCSDKYATMTASQFSVDQTFLNIVAADKKYAKNIQTGDVVIKRPNRQAYTDRDVELKDVKFVGGNVVRYQREQTKLRWKKLKEVLTEDDILGNKSVEYFMEKWEELLDKYSE